MRLTLKNSENCINTRINISKKDVPCLDSSWHYHPEFELLYISKSNGIRFVGDSVAHFSPGDLVLVGSYLPHLWRNDVSYYNSDGSGSVKTIVIKFTKNFIGQGTFDNPEFLTINQMLDDSKFGICFSKNMSERLHAELLAITSLSPAEQSIKLLKILHQLSKTEERMILSSTDMRQFAVEDSERLDTVIKYISDNYSKKINLKLVSDIACMTTNSFCRFFKKKTNKSFTQFLNEVRIRNAARLLVQNNASVTEVCYAVGYRSITNFYKQFKHITGYTPKEYQHSVV